MKLSHTAAIAFLKGQAKAAEHLQICSRCRGLFAAALDEIGAEEGFDLLRQGAFGITAMIIRELRDCPDWPPGA